MGEGEGWECGIRFTRQVELGVICKAVDINIKFTENIAKKKKVSDEKRGPQDSALGDT